MLALITIIPTKKVNAILDKFLDSNVEAQGLSNS